MRGISAATTLLLLLIGTHSALAAEFTVTPVRIYMKPEDRAVAVTITNQTDVPVLLQADLYTWTQKADGTDETTLTDDLALVPPIIKLAGNGRQVVRLVRVKPADQSRQLTYRMILREVREAAASKETVQVAITLALSMPIFITPAQAKREVACEAAQVDGQRLNVACVNKGSAYAQVREITVKQRQDVLGRFEGGAYILPGARKVLSIDARNAAPGSRVQLVVIYDDGRSDLFEVTVR